MVLACTCFVVFMLIHTQILFVPSNKIAEINVVSRACGTRHVECVESVEPVELDVSSVLSHAVRQARHSQSAWARQVKRV